MPQRCPATLMTDTRSARSFRRWKRSLATCWIAASPMPVIAATTPRPISCACAIGVASGPNARPAAIRKDKRVMSFSLDRCRPDRCASFSTFTSPAFSCRSERPRVALLRFRDAGRAYHLAPAVDLGLDVDRQVLDRRTVDCNQSERGEPLLYFGQCRDAFQLRMKPGHDVLRRLRRCDEHMPPTGVVSWDARLRERRDIRRCRHRSHQRHAERT